MCFGDQRDCVTAFINIDVAAVGDWAERRGLAYSGYPDLAAKPEVYELIRECVEKVNRDLAADAKLANSQIRRFLVLHKELDADDGELTRTRKVRRAFIAEKYAPLGAARSTTARRSAASTPRSSSRTGARARSAPSSRSGMPRGRRPEWIRAPSPAA